MPGKMKKNGPAAPPVPLQPMPHVKVFRLNDERRWEDCGDGHVTIDYLEGSNGEVVLAVLDAEDDETLLLHVITPDDIYRKQEETFIWWRDSEAGMELSLSFQDAAACSQGHGLPSAEETKAWAMMLPRCNFLSKQHGKLENLPL